MQIEQIIPVEIIPILGYIIIGLMIIWGLIMVILAAKINNKITNIESLINQSITENDEEQEEPKEEIVTPEEQEILDMIKAKLNPKRR